jgi:hypothetical protein
LILKMWCYKAPSVHTFNQQDNSWGTPVLVYLNFFKTELLGWLLWAHHCFCTGVCPATMFRTSLLHHGTDIEMAGRWRHTSPKGVTDFENTQPSTTQSHALKITSKDQTQGNGDEWCSDNCQTCMYMWWVKCPNTDQCILLKHD